MNRDRIEGQWEQQRGKLMRYWGKIMDGQLTTTGVKFKKLVGKPGERQGIAKQKINNQGLEIVVQQEEKMKAANEKRPKRRILPNSSK